MLVAGGTLGTSPAEYTPTLPLKPPESTPHPEPNLPTAYAMYSKKKKGSQDMQFFSMCCSLAKGGWLLLFCADTLNVHTALHGCMGAYSAGL